MPLPGVFGELPRIVLRGSSENPLQRKFVNRGLALLCALDISVLVLPVL